MHPLEKYIAESGDTLSTFAQRVCVEEADIVALINGETLPDLAVVRRIMVQSDGCFSLSDVFDRAPPNNHIDNDLVDSGLTRQNTQNSGHVVDFASQHSPCSDNASLDQTVLGTLLQDMLPEFISCSKRYQLIIELAAQSMANSYCALSSVTSLQGHARLVQALQPALSRILEDCAEPPVGPDTVGILAEQMAQQYHHAIQAAGYQSVRQKG